MDISLDEARDILASTDFKIPGIHILKLQPGVGKTHTIRNFLKKQRSFIITTSSHKLLQEEYEGIGAKHWHGLPKKCALYKRISKLHSAGISIDIICRINSCDKKTCEYWKQFNTKKAIAPLQYLPTNRVNYKTGQKEFKFDILVVDEALKEFNLIEYDMEKLVDSIEAIEEYYEIQFLLDQFLAYLDSDTIPPFGLVNQINQIKNTALLEAIGKKKWNDVNEIAKLDIYELRKFIYYHNIYGNMDTYPEPYFYYVMDLALQGIPVIFLDATFDEKAFKILLGRYIYENNIIPRSLLIQRDLDSINNLNIELYQSNLVNKDVKIHRMDKNNYYYRSGFFNRNGELTTNGIKSIKELREYIIKAKRKFNSVGIITYKKITKEFIDLGPTDYFHNLRGSNTIKNVGALFIIGTPQSNKGDIVEGYNNLCLTQYDVNDIEKLSYISKDGDNYLDGIVGPFKEKKPVPLCNDPEDIIGISSIATALEFQKRKGIVDADIYYTLPEFDYNSSESEKYQAVHRARLVLKQEPPSIYMFGDVPTEIREEFNLITKNKKNTRSYFIGNNRFNGIYPIPLFRLINEEIINNPTLTSEDIAIKLKLYKNLEKSSGFNSRFVTAIKKGKVSVEQINRIHETLIINKNADLKLIEKNLKSLKVDREFIESCIFYAMEGNFVVSKS